MSAACVLNPVLFVAPATAAAECEWLRERLRRLDAALQPETFATLSDAARWLRQHDSKSATVIVVQSTPDEFAADEVNALIGECPQARVLSAYGPWCVSDGRTRSIWPEACRVPLTSVPALLQAEQSFFRQFASAPDSVPPRPAAHSPLAAPEELAEWQSRVICSDLERATRSATVLVLSDDRVLRETIAAALTAWGHSTRHAATRTIARAIMTEAPALQIPEDVVVLDIDDAADDVRTVRSSILNESRRRLIFITGFPALSLQPVPADASATVPVIPKTDLLLRLRDELQECLPVEAS